MAERSEWRLKTCVWETTLACNASCMHCGEEAERSERGADAILGDETDPSSG